MCSFTLLYWRRVFQSNLVTDNAVMQSIRGQLIVKKNITASDSFVNSHCSRLLPVLGLDDIFNFDKDKCCLCPSVEALKERIDWLLEEGYRPPLEPGSKLKGNFLSLSVTLSSSWSRVMLERDWDQQGHRGVIVISVLGILWVIGFYRESSSAPCPSVWIYLSG